MAKYCSQFFYGSVVLMFSFMGCGAREDSSAMKFRPYDPNAKNVFLVMGAPNGLAGVPTDVREMTAVLEDSSNGYNWSVVTNGNASKSYILDQLTSQSAAVGEDGTLGFYVSGHGSRDGKFMTADGMLGYGEVARAIAAGRAEPLKRLMSFNDSCFSGHWVDGNGSLPEGMRMLNESAEFFADPSPEEAQILAETQAQIMTDELTASGDKSKADKIEQFLTFAASKKSQTSLDMGRAKGGAFTWALRQTFASLKKDNREATMGEFAQKTVDKTWQDTRHHLPVYKAIPTEMLSEKVFEFAD
jgi:hypothetical protein